MITWPEKVEETPPDGALYDPSSPQSDQSNAQTEQPNTHSEQSLNVFEIMERTQVGSIHITYQSYLEPAFNPYYIVLRYSFSLLKQDIFWPVHDSDDLSYHPVSITP